MGTVDRLREIGSDRNRVFGNRAWLLEAADEIERLHATRQKELGYATRLAEYLWEKQGGKQDAPHWKPLPDLMGVLSQIDNMIAGYNWKK